jgi:glycosyltransferase involved in cell wall biosynthesis
MAARGVIAYGLAPYGGGTTTLYRVLAQGLRERGWQVCSVAVGAGAYETFDPQFGDEHSVILAPDATGLTAQVKVFLEWVDHHQVNLVIPNTQANLLAAVPHLPSRVRCLSICHSVSRGSYLAATVHRERLSAVVAINRRQMEDLTGRWRLPAHLVRLIPHGIDLSRFSSQARPPKAGEPLRLTFLGRLDDLDKGVMLLPAILQKTEKLGVDFSCDIIGSGPDAERLKRSLEASALKAAVGFAGQVPPQEVPARLTSADIFLMPSRFEGFGLSLVEAMAAGSVPVATRLQGITDMIVADGVSGFLCPMGDTRAFAEKIAWLSRHRDRLGQMSAQARKRVREAFSHEQMSAAYDALFTEILSRPPISYAVRPWGEAAFPRELRPTWRTLIPLPVKNFARRWLYRLGGRIP